MAKYYASLVGPLLGLYYPLPFEDDTKNRIALQSSQLRSLWCTIYPESRVLQLLEKYPNSCMLPDKFIAQLDYNIYEVNGVLGVKWAIGITEGGDNPQYDMCYGPFETVEEALEVEPKYLHQGGFALPKGCFHILALPPDETMNPTHKWNTLKKWWEPI